MAYLTIHASKTAPSRRSGCPAPPAAAVGVQPSQPPQWVSSLRSHYSHEFQCRALSGHAMLLTTRGCTV
eukprot:364894-Chlamydomonas_euryale.AAC.5